MTRHTDGMEPLADLDRLLGPRDVVVVEGPDASKYLHSQVSQDMQGMVEGEQRWTFVLEPTGKIESLARVTKHSDERFDLDTDAGYGQALLTRLDRFKIRVAATTQLDAVSDTTSNSADDDVEADRIAAGWPRMGAEIVPGDTIPGGTGLTAIAVSFTKGCYPGQEPIARLHNRGHVNRRLRVLELENGELPASGAEIRFDGKPVGRVTSAVAGLALGYVRVEVPEDSALDAGGVPARMRPLD